MRGKRALPLSLALLLSCFLLIPVAGHAGPWIIEESDTAEPISEAQIDELEKQALAGDRRLREEFAAAYLESRYPRLGCQHLKHGHRCRAMGKRTKSGHAFLMEIVNAEAKNELERIEIGAFQFRYAMLRYRESAPRYDQETEACKDAVRYYELAVLNENPCVANDLYLMAWLGHCMPKSIEQANAYRTKIPPLRACPKI
jgi:hypothetical protein